MIATTRARLEDWRHWATNGGKFTIVMLAIIAASLFGLYLQIRALGDDDGLVIEATGLTIIEPVVIGGPLIYEREYCNLTNEPVTATVQRRFLQRDPDDGERELSSIDTGTINLGPKQCQTARRNFTLPSGITPGQWELRLLITTTTPTIRQQATTSEPFEIYAAD